MSSSAYPVTVALDALTVALEWVSDLSTADNMAFVSRESGRIHMTSGENFGVEPAQGGSLTAEQYDAFARDLTAFLTYVGEPMKLERQHLGLWVLLFLAVFFVPAYFRKKEYWKDVH